MIDKTEMLDPAEGNPELTILVYLLDHAKRTDDPEGDFVEDARGEIAAGRFASGNSWSHIEFHLRIAHAHEDAVAAARRVYNRRYLPWVRSRAKQ